MTALALVPPPADPAAPAPTLAQALATYRARDDLLTRARARLAVIEAEHQQAARAVHVAAAGKRLLIDGTSVVYVEGTAAAPVLRIIGAEVVR